MNIGQFCIYRDQDFSKISYGEEEPSASTFTAIKLPLTSAEAQIDEITSDEVLDFYSFQLCKIYILKEKISNLHKWRESYKYNYPKYSSYLEDHHIKFYINRFQEIITQLTSSQLLVREKIKKQKLEFIISIDEDLELKLNKKESKLLIERLKKGPNDKVKKFAKESIKFYEEMKKKAVVYKDK